MYCSLVVWSLKEADLQLDALKTEVVQMTEMNVFCLQGASVIRKGDSRELSET